MSPYREKREQKETDKWTKHIHTYQ